MRIAIDAMGGDRAPGEIVKGAVLAAREGAASRIVLVGIEDDIRAALAETGAEPDLVDILHASQTVTMDETPSESLRKKKDSSIARAVGLLKNGDADAVISAGNTGAFVATATLYAKTIEGVKRPGIAAPLPRLDGGTTLLIDVGANIYCKPLHLAQYGIMGACYARRMFDMESPRIGLINIGEESEKGTALMKETNTLFAKAGLNYVGYVEGQDVYHDAADVFVCEGFVGNTILKVSEGIGQMLLDFTVKELKKNGIFNNEGVRSALGALGTLVDYATYGGAPLLGISGLCVICHGRSDATAIRNAIRAASKYTAQGVRKEIADMVAKLQEAVSHD